MRLTDRGRINGPRFGQSARGSSLSGALAKRLPRLQRIVLAASATIAMTLALVVAPEAAGAATTTGTVITTAQTPFGTALVVGSGKFAGYSLYFLSSDTASGFACTATKVSLPQRVHRLHESLDLSRRVARDHDDRGAGGERRRQGQPARLCHSAGHR